MSLSGIRVADDIPKEFEDLKIRRKHKYLLMKISDDEKEIEICKKGERKSGVNESWEEFKQDLDEAKSNNQGRYCVYDYTYKENDGTENSKLMFAVWCDDNIKMKQRMMYAASKEGLVKKLNGVALRLEWHGTDEVDEETIDHTLKKK